MSVVIDHGDLMVMMMVLITMMMATLITTMMMMIYIYIYTCIPSLAISQMPKSSTFSIPKNEVTEVT